MDLFVQIKVKKTHPHNEHPNLAMDLSTQMQLSADPSSAQSLKSGVNCPIQVNGHVVNPLRASV
jgi:hypothetical protein